MAPLATILLYRDVRAPASASRRSGAGRTRLRSFTVPALLTAQLDRVVESGRPVVTVAAILAALAGGPPLPPGAVALGFDGALADHHDVVLPLLLARGLAASFHLPAAPVAERRVVGVHKIQFVLAAADSEQDVTAAVFDLVAEHRHAGAALAHGDTLWDEMALAAGTHPDIARRETMFVNRLLRSGLPAAVRGQVIDRLFHTFVTADEAAFADELYLTPAQARALMESGMEVGGNGSSGDNLQGLPPPAQAVEIAATAAFLTGTVGLPAGRLLFAYPAGGWDEVTLDLLPAHGFAAGLTGHRGHVVPDSDPLRLPRCDAARDFDSALG